MSAAVALEQTERWLAEFVIGLNLCPFAGRPFKNGRVRIVVSTAASEQALTADWLSEGEALLAMPAVEVETTLVVHPFVLQRFPDYNDYLWAANERLVEQGWEGELQLASFHPDYQFAGEGPHAASNYTNRSPYPMLHLIREDSLERALQNFDNPEEIPQRNIELMEKLGAEQLRSQLLGYQNENGSHDDA
ncbi:DUF1415 domain-containing protein [Phaeodactylibacter luteus]|uniref:DUF1415 domain-containing protein n=1 Tax=Phaeodactylibacter luteus TaxID=1564516 RepID=UPI0037447B03